MSTPKDMHAELMTLAKNMMGASWAEGTPESYESERLALDAYARTLTDRIAELERFEFAFKEWLSKTEWVQEKIHPKELGKHRADILRERIAELEARLEIDPAHSYDGIDCRDATIHDLEAQLEAVGAMAPKPCNHKYFYFGSDEQKRRRCNFCDALEPEPVTRPLEAAPVTDDGSEGTSFVDSHRDEIAVLAEKAGIAPMLAWPFARAVLNLANSGVLVLTAAISDGEVKATCAIAGVNYLPPDADPDGYPGGFDMTSLDDMRKIIAASRASAAQPAPAVVGPVAAESRFHGQRWRECTVEHAAMVMAAPHDWHGYEARYLYTAPQPQQIAEPASQDTNRLDWLETQGVSYGFEDLHEGNRWTIEGPFRTLRTAIDEYMPATPKESS